MLDTIVANWNSKKFLVLILLSILAQFFCFLIGIFDDSQLNIRQNILGIPCKDERVNNTEIEFKKWYYTKGKKNCEIVDMFMYDSKIQDKVFQVVYTIQISLPKNNNELYYSRLQENLIGILHFDIIYHSQFEIPSLFPLVLDVNLAYRDNDDPDDDWKFYAESRVEKILKCSKCNEDKHYNFDCMPIPLFELGSLYHDYYLLNIRFPHIDTSKNINQILSYMTDTWLTVITQNGTSTTISIALQTFFFLIAMNFIIWYWKQILVQTKSPTLLQYMVLIMGFALLLLNIPLEYLTFYLNKTVILHLSDVKQGIFYTVLLSFYLIFVGEHLMVQRSSSLKYYWRHLSVIFVVCLSLFIHDIFERIVQIENPFFTVAFTDITAEFNLPLVTLIEILAGFYLILLTYMIWKVFININITKMLLPSMNSIRRLHYRGVIFRFKLLMIATLFCASLTIIGFILRQIMKSQWKWNEDYKLKTISAFFTGVYGMWNIYIITLLCLYAPLNRKKMID